MPPKRCYSIEQHLYYQGGTPNPGRKRLFPPKKLQTYFEKTRFLENVFSVEQFSAGLPWDGILAVPIFFPTKMHFLTLFGTSRGLLTRPTRKTKCRYGSTKSQRFRPVCSSNVTNSSAIPCGKRAHFEISGLRISNSMAYVHFPRRGKKDPYSMIKVASNGKKCSKRPHFCHFFPKFHVGFFAPKAMLFRRARKSSYYQENPKSSEICSP